MLWCGHKHCPQQSSPEVVRGEGESKCEKRNIHLSFIKIILVAGEFQAHVLLCNICFVKKKYILQFLKYFRDNVSLNSL